MKTTPLASLLLDLELKHGRKELYKLPESHPDIRRMRQVANPPKKTVRARRKKWTAEHDAFLLANWDKMKWEDIAFQVGFTVEHVRRKGKKLGLPVKKRNAATPVAMVDESGAALYTYPSVAEAGRQTGVASANIWSACQGRTKQAGGYLWRYVKDLEGGRMND